MITQDLDKTDQLLLIICVYLVNSTSKICEQDVIK